MENCISSWLLISSRFKPTHWGQWITVWLSVSMGDNAHTHTNDRWVGDANGHRKREQEREKDSLPSRPNQSSLYHIWSISIISLDYFIWYRIIVRSSYNNLCILYCIYWAICFHYSVFCWCTFQYTHTHTRCIHLNVYASSLDSSSLY